MSEKTIERWEDDLDEPIAVRTGMRTKIVVRRRRGKLFARLFDETGGFVLRDTAYEATGEWQDQISGTTDGDGVLLHEDLPIGDFPIKVDGKYDTVIPTVLTSDPDPHDQVVEGCQVEESVDEFPDCPQDILVHPREL